MESGRRCRAVVTAAAAGLFVATPFAAPPFAAAGAMGTSSSHHSAPRLARAGHVKFWQCSSKTTEMLVAVNTLTLHPGATLDITFTVRNGGTSACSYTAPYAGVTAGPTATMLHAGPCGSIGFEVETTHGHEVWPGAQLVNCPALGLARLAPNATVSGTATWDQDKTDTTQRVPAGSYTLVVANKMFTFPLHVASS